MSQLRQPPLGELAPNARFIGVYALINPQLGQTRTGKPFLKGILRDATGEAVLRGWEFEAERIGSLSSTGFVRVAGASELYQNLLQIKVEAIEAAQPTEDELRLLRRTSTKDIHQMFERVSAIMRSLEHPAMRALAEAYLDDANMMAGFRRAPAATVVHHAFVGGLLEHTHQLLEIAELTLPLYPALNRDLVLMGLFLHDLGKLVEIDGDKGGQYTLDGELIGHIVRGALWLQGKAVAVAAHGGPRLSPEALTALQHIILSHHTQPEHGAAKRPATPEAVFVACLDQLDAKTAATLGFAQREKVGPDSPAFTERAFFLDNTRVYRPDPLADQAG